MRFSIRALLLLTAVVALLVAIVFSFPNWLASISLCLLLPAISAATITAAFYGRGDIRAFALGVLGVAVPASSVIVAFVILDFGSREYNPIADFITIMAYFDDGAMIFKSVGVLFAALLIPSGLTGVVTRRLLLSWQDESRSATRD